MPDDTPAADPPAPTGWERVLDKAMFENQPPCPVSGSGRHVWRVANDPITKRLRTRCFGCGAYLDELRERTHGNVHKDEDDDNTTRGE